MEGLQAVWEIDVSSQKVTLPHEMLTEVDVRSPGRTELTEGLLAEQKVDRS